MILRTTGESEEIAFAEHRRECSPRSVFSPVVTARQIGDQRRQASNEISDPFSPQRARGCQLLESIKVVLAQAWRKHVSRVASPSRTGRVDLTADVERLEERDQVKTDLLVFVSVPAEEILGEERLEFL